MSKKDNVITLDVVHELVDIKAKDPGITPDDLFKSVASVRSDDSKVFWKRFGIPVAVYGFSCLGMLFLATGNTLHRLSLIVFGVSNVWGYSVLKKFNRSWWWVIVLGLLVLYAVYAEEISSETIERLIEKIINK